jgi:hypothetical protein
MVSPGFAEPRDIADIDSRHILDLDGDAFRLAQHGVFNVADLVALGEVHGAAAVD